MRRSPARTAVAARDRAPADPAPAAVAGLAGLALGLAAALALAGQASGQSSGQASGESEVVDREEGRDWAVGRPLPDDADWTPIDAARHDLPSLDRGERYVRFQGMVLRVTGTPEAGLIVLASEGEAAELLD
ncbi:MAG: hypothetical protein R6V44_04975 [Paracoccaceae bacterium]